MEPNTINWVHVLLPAAVLSILGAFIIWGFEKLAQRRNPEWNWFGFVQPIGSKLVDFTYGVNPTQKSLLVLIAIFILLVYLSWWQNQIPFWISFVVMILLFVPWKRVFKKREKKN